MKSILQRGSILISKPFIEDTRFNKTIILISEHNNMGTVGYILNKNTNDNIGTTLNIKSNKIIKYGGPVETDTLFFIHNQPQHSQGSHLISNDLYWGGEIEQIIHNINLNDFDTNNILFFLGYTGWQPKQLEEEINEGSWIIYDRKINIINQDLSWSKLLIEINKEFEVWANAPINFHLN